MLHCLLVDVGTRPAMFALLVKLLVPLLAAKLSTRLASYSESEPQCSLLIIRLCVSTLFLQPHANVRHTCPHHSLHPQARTTHQMQSDRSRPNFNSRACVHAFPHHPLHPQARKTIKCNRIGLDPISIPANVFIAFCQTAQHT